MDKLEAKLALDMGTQFYGEGKLEEALQYYNKALELFQKSKDEQKEADILLEMADIQLELGNLEGSSKNYEKSQGMYHKIGDLIGEGYSLTGRGIVFERYKKYGEARDYYDEAIVLFQKAKDYHRAGVVSNLIAHTYEMQDALEDALVDYKNSLELFEKVKDHSRDIEIYEALDRIEKRRSKFRISKKVFLYLMGYLLAIIAAEIITANYSLGAGLVLEIVIIFALLTHSSLTESYNLANLLRAVMILPMIRIIGSSLPLMNVPTLYWYPIISIPLFAASFVLMRNQKLTRKKVGLVWGNIPVQLLIALSGLALGFIEFYILKPQPLIPSLTLVPFITATIILLISTGFAEELVFRGILQRNAENLFGNLFGLIYASLLFTSLHIGWHSFLDLIFVLGVALLYGYAFQKTRSLFGITLSHGLSNSVLFLVMPFI
ncbi:MAG: tetratricopeptide repeat protein, partial [Methanobacterium sp.]